MGKFWKHARGSAGFSLIEIMIAGGILAFIAIAVLPAVFKISESSKPSGFKAQCTALARAKLAEYMNGVADSGLFASGFTPTGFEYTKARYKANRSSCDLNPSAGSPGYRESVYSNSILAATDRELDAQNRPAMSNELLGFQMWVMIRHYNPRILSTGGQPTRACPEQQYQFFQVGDALEVTVTGMIRTEPLISEGGRKAVADGTSAAFGPYRDLNPTTPHPMLTCSVTDVVYQPSLPFRYFLTSEGVFINLQAKLAENTGTQGKTVHASQAHFRNVWSLSTDVVNAPDGSDRVPIHGIKSIVVSPDNRYVYVLRSGELARYGPCSEMGSNVVIGGVTRSFGGNVTVNLNGDEQSFEGIPDCPPRPSIATFSIPGGTPDGLTWDMQAHANIEQLAVDFKTNYNPAYPLDLAHVTDDTFYGMTNLGAGVVGGAGKLYKIQESPLPTGSPYRITWDTTDDFSLPPNKPRIRGFFIAQNVANAANMFFFDNECYSGEYSGTQNVKGSELRYCTSLYSSSDQSMQQVMKELPLQVEAVSY